MENSSTGLSGPPGNTASHAFNQANNVSFSQSTVNVIGGNMVHNHGPDSSIDKLREIADWLSPINFWTIQINTFSKCTPDTETWFLKSQEFQSWMAKDGGALWMIGTSGSGKTILASITIDCLQERFPNGSKTAIIFAYFRYTDQYSPTDILASFVKQLLEHCSSLPTDIEDTYNKCKRKGNRLSEDELGGLFLCLSQLFSKVYVVLDALDEVLDNFRTKLLCRLSSYPVNVLLASRPFNLARLLPPDTESIIVEGQTEQDIELFIEESIEGSPDLSDLLEDDEPLQSTICALLKEKSKGMFLAVSLHLKELSKCINKNVLRNTAQSLPSDLDGMYQVTLQQIEAQESERAALARWAIIWLTHARRSLTITELQHALAVRSENNTFDKDDITRAEWIVSWRCGLIVIDEKIKIARLAHYTAYDFFQKTQSLFFSTPHTLIVTACIAYLLAFNFSEQTWQSRRQLHRFLSRSDFSDYAYHHWGFHARNCYGELGLPDSVSKFVLQCSVYPSELWMEVDYSKGQEMKLEYFLPSHLAAYYGFPELFASMADFHNQLTQGQWTPLILASMEGHDETVKLLVLHKEIDLNLYDKSGSNALTLAVKNGHEGVVKLLLACVEINVNLRDKSGYNALTLAVDNGHEGIVKLLLSCKEININLCDKYGRNALILAAENGHEGIVKLLLSCKQIDLHLHDKFGRNVLTFAAEYGYETMIELLLLQQEVDLNRYYDKFGRNALMIAAKIGREGAVKLLLSRKKIDLNLHDQLGRNALTLAVRNGHEGIVELLLSHKEINLNRHDKSGRTALALAVENGQEEIVKLLLSCKEINLNLHDQLGRNALTLAVGNGHEGIVKLLLSHKEINLNRHDKSGRTALALAVKNGQEEIVKLLLSRKEIDLNWHDKFGCDILTLAVGNGHEGIVKLLLSHKEIDLNLHDKFGHNALTLAVDNGREEIVKLLLSCKEIDVLDVEFGCNALILAVKNGHEGIVKLLLSCKQIDLHLHDKFGLSALMIASENGHDAIVKLLFSQKGINVNLHDHYDRNALILASVNGHGSIVELLLSHEDIKINLHDQQGGTALMYASRWGREGTAKLLLSRQEINVNLHDQEGATALMIASWMGHEGIVKLL